METSHDGKDHADAGESKRLSRSQAEEAKGRSFSSQEKDFGGGNIPKERKAAGGSISSAIVQRSQESNELTVPLEVRPYRSHRSWRTSKTLKHLPNYVSAPKLKMKQEASLPVKENTLVLPVGQHLKGSEQQRRPIPVVENRRNTWSTPSRTVSDTAVIVSKQPVLRVSVAERAKLWTKKINQLGDISDENSSISKASVASSSKVSRTPFQKPRGDSNGLSNSYDEEDEMSVTVEIDQIDDPSDIARYEKLLLKIAGSNLEDKASRAGKVLKRMKEKSLSIRRETVRLLEECLRIPELVREPKPHEVEVETELVEIPHEPGNDEKTPGAVIKKRVRFAETNSFRIIRRRRSIGFNERWDDPLTPPKRLAESVDLRVTRFSSGQSDDLPALPVRRTDESARSLQSSSSHSIQSTSSNSYLSISSHSDRSFSSSSGGSTDASLVSDESLVDRLKLPFSDSPQPNDRKALGTSNNLSAVANSESEDKQTRNLSPLPPPHNHGKPVPPVRRRSTDDEIFLSPKPQRPTNTVYIESESAPFESPIPLAPFDSYRTPSPKPRRQFVRRRSISGTERRAVTPLTPPRRVSAPLELFIAQESLKNQQRQITKDMVSLGVEEKADATISLAELETSKIKRMDPLPGHPIITFETESNDIVGAELEDSKELPYSYGGDKLESLNSNSKAKTELAPPKHQPEHDDSSPQDNVDVTGRRPRHGRRASLGSAPTSRLTEYENTSPQESQSEHQHTRIADEWGMSNIHATGRRRKYGRRASLGSAPTSRLTEYENTSPQKSQSERHHAKLADEWRRLNFDVTGRGPIFDRRASLDSASVRSRATEKNKSNFKEISLSKKDQSGKKSPGSPKKLFATHSARGSRSLSDHKIGSNKWAKVSSEHNGRSIFQLDLEDRVIPQTVNAFDNTDRKVRRGRRSSLNH